MGPSTKGQLSKARRGFGQAEMEKKLTYQHNYRAGDLGNSQRPPNHYSVHLHRPITPGVGLTPPARTNLEGLCNDWQQNLGQMQGMTRLLHTKCERELQQVNCCVASEDTVALRRAVNASLATQMEHFTRSMAAWAGASLPPAQPTAL